MRVLDQQRSAVNNQLSKLGIKWKDFLLLSEKFLSMEAEKAEAPLRFASTENIFVVSGWIPKKNLGELDENINKITRKNVNIEVQQPQDDDNVPVKLSHQKRTKPYEFFMRLYALPKYAEIDPTIFLFITFPLFFGMILGDIGYGATAVVLLTYIGKKYKSMASLVRVMMPAAFASIFFGFVFGEVFGYEALPHLISRIHQTQEMLFISLIIGLLHVNIGLVLGFLNELSHGLKKAILAKGSWWILQAGVALLALSSLNIIPISTLPGWILIGLSVIMIYLGESFIGILEIPALLSNVLSYSRLMAVGLASVGLASVVNEFTTTFFAKGGIMIVVAIFVGLVGHALNIVLGLVGGFLHALRLHYVEFFTKFFKGGAIPFQPFGSKMTEVQ